MKKINVIWIVFLLFSVGLPLNLTIVTQAQSVTYQFQLHSSYNLITIHVANNFYASTLAENITGCLMISYWNTSIQSYQSYIVGGPQSFDFPIEDGIGYNILVENDTTFTVSGNLLTDVSTTLVQGYNLLGWYKTESTTASYLFNTISGCVNISIWDATNQVNKYYRSSFDEDFIIEQGMGYFVEIQPLKPLEISAPSFITERTNFQVAVTSSGVPVSNVLINCFDNTLYTDSSGYVALTAPSIDKDTVYFITASKTGYLSNEFQITVKANITPDEKQLIITVPFSVTEGENFKVSVTSDGSAVESVLVTFLGYSYYTAVDGTVTISSPLVETDTAYSINADKEGYLSDEVLISVKNYVIPTSWIYGSVFEQQNNSLIPLEDVVVCIRYNLVTSKCIFTDEKGEYNISVPIGTYVVEANKTGYIKNTSGGITVSANKGTKIDFILQKAVQKTSKSLTDYIIEEEIKKGSVMGSVDVTSIEQQVILYSDINIQVNSTDLFSSEGIKIIVSGEETPGTKIVVYLGSINNTADLIVTYDGIEIKQNKDVAAFFNTGNENAEWILTSTEHDEITEYILIINIPHFSEHTIAIYSSFVEETVKKVMQYKEITLAIAVTLIAIAGLAMFRKRKEE